MSLVQVDETRRVSIPFASTSGASTPASMLVTVSPTCTRIMLSRFLSLQGFGGNPSPALIKEAGFYLSCFFLTAFLLLGAKPANAHLLNMSVVHVSVSEDRDVSISVEVDMSREFEDRSAYFEASQIRDPLGDEKINALLKRIFSSVELQLFYQDEVVLIDSDKRWKIQSIVFLESEKSKYLDPLSWPKVEVNATTKVQRLPSSIAAKFKSDFIFEEPIAVTLEDEAANKTKSRWLIAYQTSPALALAGQEASPLVGADDTSRMENLLFYFLQGFKHVIPMGFDHMLFVFGLALAFLNLRSLILMASVFTAAHCLTLLISVYGVFRIPGYIVEPVIALSIAWSGWELVRRKQKASVPIALIFFFGLFHGLGFAGAIAELGLPTTGALLALLGFNLGIELAQLIVMLLGFCLCLVVLYMKGKLSYVHKSAGFSLIGLGSLWAVSRVIL